MIDTLLIDDKFCFEDKSAARLERSSFCEEPLDLAWDVTNKKAGVEGGTAAQISSFQIFLSPITYYQCPQASLRTIFSNFRSAHFYQ